ncbi:MAG: LamG domain-containing protein [Planctomycetota bacterium]
MKPVSRRTSFAGLALAIALALTPALCADGGFALDFDGVNDYLQIPYREGAFPDGDLTLTAWVRMPDPAARRACIFNRGEDDSSDWGSWRLEVLPGGNLQVAFEDCSDNDGFYEVAADLDDGQWHHVAATRERGRLLKVYVDGELAGTFTGTISPCSLTRQKITIGAEYARPGGVINYFDGQIDEVSMWKVELTEAEVQSIYSQGIEDSLVPDLLGFWDFDEGTGQSVFDQSIAGNHGILGSSTEPDVSDPTWIDTEETGSPPTLDQDPLVHGQLAHLIVSGAHPNDFVAFFVSFTGQSHNGGPCFPRLEDICLDLLSPVTHLGTVRASSAGTAIHTVSIPAGAPLIPVFTQAIVVQPPYATCSRKTNWVESLIE